MAADFPASYPHAMSSWDGDITPAVLLDHLHALKADLVDQIQRLGAGLSSRMDRIETRLESLDAKESRHFHLLSAQIDAVDKRLDVVEIALVERR